METAGPSALRVVRNNIQMFGVRQTVKDLLVQLLVHPADGFDQKYGVSTSGKVPPADAGIQDLAVLDGALDYQPTRVQVMQHILGFVTQRLDPREFSFVDLGCGKGRAVLMATQWPFREIVGVEASAAHCAVARRNLEVFLAREAAGETRANARIIQADVAQFEFPESDLLVYMYNPFRASVLGQVLERLARFRARQARRVYVSSSCPAHGGLFRAHPAFVHQQTFQVLSRNSSWDLWECRGA